MRVDCGWHYFRNTLTYGMLPVMFRGKCRNIPQRAWLKICRERKKNGTH